MGPGNEASGVKLGWGLGMRLVQNTIFHKYCMYLSPYVGSLILKNEYGWLPSVCRKGQQSVVAEERKDTQAA